MTEHNGQNFGRQRTTVEIADLAIALDTDGNSIRVALDEPYRHFLCPREPDVTIEVSGAPMPEITLSEANLVFRTADLWGLYCVQGQNILVQRRAFSSSTIERLMVFDRDFRRGEFFCRGRETRSVPVNPLHYPLGQILMVCVLALGKGLMVHASGVDDNGSGYLFAGNSGHGKSTLCSLWEGEGRVLNDDRIILRLIDGKWWMHSTPWHGSYATLSTRSVPLSKIFFLGRGHAHVATPKQNAEAACLLLTRSFPPLWDEAGMRFTMDLVARLTGDVPCYELAFVPEKSVVDFVRCVK